MLILWVITITTEVRFNLMIFILVGIKYTFLIISSMLAIFGTLFAYALNILFFYWVSAILIGIVNLGG